MTSQPRPRKKPAPKSAPVAKPKAPRKNTTDRNFNIPALPKAPTRMPRARGSVPKGKWQYNERDKNVPGGGGWTWVPNKGART